MSSPQITILIDNTPCPDPTLHLASEHGLSLYVEDDEHRYLIDTGKSGCAIDNAITLGIDIAQIDILILSHGHNDHTGGLQRFLKQNQIARIFCSQHIIDTTYTSTHHGILHNLTPDADLIRENIHRFQFVNENRLIISNTLSLFKCNNKQQPCPAGNNRLHCSRNGINQPYTAEDELCVCISHQSDETLTSQCHTLISPCSHSGLLNILQAFTQTYNCNREDIHQFIGGLHLLDEYMNIDNVTSLANTLSALYPTLLLYTGHCTGNHATEVLSVALQSHFKKFYTGATIPLFTK